MTSLENLWVRLRYAVGRAVLGDRLTVKGRKQDIHAYWSAPPGKGNQPQAYVDHPERSAYLIDVLRRVSVTEGSMLEIGCNVGRNLAALQGAGYGPLTGIEINAGALAELRAVFPDLHARATLINQPVEDALPAMADGAVDVCFTMAVLLHIHPDSDWVFAHMLRVARRYLVVIENEDQSSYKIFPRDYGAIFRALGAEEVLTEPTGADLRSYTTRVFRVPDRT